MDQHDLVWTSGNRLFLGEKRELRQMGCNRSSPAHYQDIVAVGVSPFRKYIATASKDGGIALWRAMPVQDDDAAVAHTHRSGKEPQAIAVGLDGENVFTAVESTVYVYRRGEGGWCGSSKRTLYMVQELSSRVTDRPIVSFSWVDAHTLLALDAQGSERVFRRINRAWSLIEPPHVEQQAGK